MYVPWYNSSHGTGLMSVLKSGAWTVFPSVMFDDKARWCKGDRVKNIFVEYEKIKWINSFVSTFYKFVISIKLFSEEYN